MFVGGILLWEASKRLSFWELRLSGLGGDLGGVTKRESARDLIHSTRAGHPQYVQWSGRKCRVRGIVYP